jgi:two-component system response regulator DesR
MDSSHSPVKVFLADDSALIRARVAAMLGAPPMTIVGESPTPQGAIDGILATHPDVVVLDAQLDGGTGLDVLRAVHPAAPDIAFIVFSNSSAPAYRQKYLAAGAVRYLDKNAEFDQLAQAVTDAGRRPAH